MEKKPFFWHHRDFRNEKRVKSLRLKHGVDGYGVLMVLLEVLAEHGGTMVINEVVIHQLSEDYGTDTLKLKEILDDCIKLSLFDFNEENSTISYEFE